MKKMDNDGLLLCNAQGHIFALSRTLYPTSSDIFIRRFMLSKSAMDFDSKAFLDDSFTASDVLDSLTDEFGESSYGKNKYGEEALFWIGYIYRYFAYTYELSSKSVYRLLKGKELNERYYIYHTFDPSIAIERILEENGISFDLDKQNERLLMMLKERLYEKELNLRKKKEDENGESLEIAYKDECIGEVTIKKTKKDERLVELDIDSEFRNKPLELVAMRKTVDFENESRKMTLVSKIRKDDETMNEVCKRLGFLYRDESSDFVYFIKALN